MKYAGCHTRANVNMRDYTMPLEATDGHREILYWTHSNAKYLLLRLIPDS